MKVPVGLKITLLTVGATAFYTYVGQLVPQKEVHPPQEVQLKADMTPQEMVETGRQIMDGKGMCTTCHTVGQTGALRFPDLAGIGSRAASRVPGLTDAQYLAQSLYEPDTYIVPGFLGGMPAISRPPISLSEQEILAVIAALQSMGGEVTVTLDTDIQQILPPAEGGG
jgi:mono/diheme cytochrome c family protein